MDSDKELKEFTRQNIIPIVYCTGSGGQFLAAFLTSAKLNDPNVIQLSRFGNAHGSIKDIKETHFNSVTDILIRVKKISVYPGYVPFHGIDMPLVRESFDKIIKIQYDHDDIEELAKIFTGKWGLDDGGSSFDKLQSTYEWSISNLQKYTSQFDSDTMNDMCISWKELYKNDPNILINKLSEFTGYATYRFPVEKLNEWRRLTEICVVKMSKLVKKV